MKRRLRRAHGSGAYSWKEGFQLWAVSLTGKPSPFFPPILHTPLTGRSLGQWPKAVAVCLSRRQKPGLPTWAGRADTSSRLPRIFPSPFHGSLMPTSAPGGPDGGCLWAEGRGLHLGLCRVLIAMGSLPCGRERTLHLESEVPLPGGSINNHRVVLDRSHRFSEPRCFGLSCGTVSSPPCSMGGINKSPWESAPNRKLWAGPAA